MTAKTENTSSVAIRGSVLHFLDDPRDDTGEDTFEFFEDGLLVIDDGYITKIGAAQDLIPGLPAGVSISDYSGQLILPGFVDTHVHFVQTDIIGSYGGQLLSWLDLHAYPAERAFAEEEHANEVADFFVRELLRNGTTTALILGSVHKGSVDAVFRAAEQERMRVIAGKVMMDRNCPDYLRDTPASSYEDSKSLIESWHNRDRLQYAVTPRFAPTSSPEQLDCAGQLVREFDDVFVHTHLAETQDEVAWVKRLFPDSRSYLDVYDRFGLLNERSVFAHGIWLDDADIERLSQTGGAISHCPSCNLFMGSGLLDIDKLISAGVPVSVGTDIGGGTSFNLMRTLHDAFVTAQLLNKRLSSLRAFYLATLAGARALNLDDHIGNFLPGKEADFVVIDPAATPLLRRQINHAESLEETLYILMTLGDDRVISETYIMGKPANKGARP